MSTKQEQLDTNIQLLSLNSLMSLLRFQFGEIVEKTACERCVCGDNAITCSPKCDIKESDCETDGGILRYDSKGCCRCLSTTNEFTTSESL